MRQRVEKLANQLQFPLKHLYVIDGSKRSSHSNAWVSFELRHTDAQVLLRSAVVEADRVVRHAARPEHSRGGRGGACARARALEVLAPDTPPPHRAGQPAVDAYDLRRVHPQQGALCLLRLRPAPGRRVARRRSAAHPHWLHALPAPLRASRHVRQVLHQLEDAQVRVPGR